VTARRRLGALAAVSPIGFTAAWAIASAAQTGYRPLREDLSALGAVGADHPWITIAGDLLLGLGIVALARGLTTAPHGRDARAGVCLLLAGGLGTIVQAVAREDCATQQPACAAHVSAGDISWHHAVHGIASAVAFCAILGAALVLARPFREHQHWHDLAGYSLLTAALGLLLLIGYIGTADTAWGGLGQRIFLTVPLLWITFVGLRLSRAAPTPA
jgi:hypothetical membrane protein